MSEGTVTNALNNAQQRVPWEQIIQVSKDIAYVLRPDGTIVDGNQSFFAALKSERREAMGRPLIDWVTADDQTVCRRALKSVRENRRSERTTRTLRGSGGQSQVFEIIETPLIQNGEVEAIAGIGRDITQEVILEQKLWDTEEDRRSTLEFALRTSMGLVKGYVYTLECGDALTAEQRKRYTHVVLDEIDNLAKIVDDLLDFHRLEENSLGMEDRLTDISECVSMAVSQFREEAERREIEVKTSIPEQLDPIHLPPDALMRVLTNLIQNSIHHTLHSGRIEIVVNDSDDYVDISVIDNGLGIAEKDLPYVFEKYYRCDSNTSATVQGAGLGLAVTRILVNALGGKIWATSVPGERTMFRFVLPRRVGVSPADTDAQDAEADDSALRKLTEQEA